MVGSAATQRRTYCAAACACLLLACISPSAAYLHGARVELPRPPSFNYVATVGCGDLVLMAWNKDSSEVLSISLEAKQFAGRELSFDLAKSEEHLKSGWTPLKVPKGFCAVGTWDATQACTRPDVWLVAGPWQDERPH